MTCFCMCHNTYAIEQGKAPHDASACDCMRVEDPTLRAKVDITEQIEEQLLQKAALEDALKAIGLHCNSVSVQSNPRAYIESNSTIIAMINKALEPTVLCLSCRKLSPSFPCVHCGKERN